MASRALRGRLAADESGQIFPILIVLLGSLIALGLLLFGAGRAGRVRADAQTAADAAALAAAKNVGDQFAGPAEEIPAAIDDAQAEAEARDFAERNDADLVSFEREELDVRVTVRTKQSIPDGGQEGGEVNGEARAQARVSPIAAIGGPGVAGSGALGAPIDGVASDVKDAIELARKMGLDITSTTGGKHAPGSYHYSGKAVDVAGSPAQMSRFFDAALERYGKNTLELFYDPKGYYVKNGGKVGGAIGGHSDHVHIALNGQGPTSGGGEASDEPSRGSRQRAESGQSPGRSGSTGGGSSSGDEDRGARDAKARNSSGAGRAEKVGVGECGGQIFRTIYAVGKKYGASAKEQLAAVETALVESNGCNLDRGDRDSLGVFQQRPSQGWGSRSQILDVEYAAGKFFAGATKGGASGGTAGQLAQSVQRSAFPERYDQQASRAKAILEKVANGELPVIDGLPGGVGGTGGGFAAGAEVRLVPYEGGS